MKTFAIVFLLIICMSQQAFPCSTFFLHHNGQMVFGRNYDWVAGTGILCTNHKNMVKKSFNTAEEEQLMWISRYGSLTFNQYGKEFPTGGMNEKGLVVELMWLDGTRYPKKDHRGALGVLQWIQYQLDNAATVEEVIASDTSVRIDDDVPLHYLVADSTGRVATIEFLNGKMVVHTGKDLTMPVLTNSVYAESAQYAKRALARNETGNTKSSNDRFLTACDMVHQYKSGKVKGSAIDHSFNILDAVSQGDYTRWSIVYDISNRRVYFKTNEVREVRSVAFADLGFKCTNKPLAFNINQPSRGDVSKLFTDMTDALNRKIIRETARLSREQVNISEKSQEAAAVYAARIGCRLLHTCHFRSGTPYGSVNRP